MLVAVFVAHSFHLCSCSSQTEAPQMPCALKTAQIQRLTSTPLTQTRMISPHPMTAAPSPPQIQTPAVLLLSQGPLPTRMHSQALTLQMDRAAALQQTRPGKARMVGMSSLKMQGSQLQMKQLRMLIRTAGQPTWRHLLNKLTSGKCCHLQTKWLGPLRNLSSCRLIKQFGLAFRLQGDSQGRLAYCMVLKTCATLDSGHTRGLEFCWQAPIELGVMSQCRGLEKALDQYAQPTSAAPVSEADPAADGDQKVREARRSSARESRKKALRNLSVPERDVLLVLGAICKVCCCICCLPTAGTPHTTHLAVHFKNRNAKWTHAKLSTVSVSHDVAHQIECLHYCIIITYLCNAPHHLNTSQEAHAWITHR